MTQTNLLTRNSREQYEVNGLPVTVSVLKNGLLVRTGKIETAEVLNQAVLAITDEAANRSHFTRDELHFRIVMGEVPHALKAIAYNSPVRLGFDITGQGLGFFTEHKDLPAEQMLEVLNAPDEHYRSGSDRRKIKNIQRKMVGKQ